MRICPTTLWLYFVWLLVLFVFFSMQGGWSQSDHYFWDSKYVCLCKMTKMPVVPHEKGPARDLYSMTVLLRFGIHQDEVSRLFLEAQLRIPSAQDVTAPSGFVDSNKSCFQYMCHSQVALVTPCPSLKARPSGNWRSEPKHLSARGSWGSSHRMDVP